MLESVWETFDGLFKTAWLQGKRIEELESRVVELERLLREDRPTLRLVTERQARLEVQVSELRHVTGITEVDEVAEQFDAESYAEV